LLLLTQSSAWIATWDDHEVSNNGYRDGSSGLNNTEASFREDGRGVSVDQRKMNAVRAYFEWMPIRQVEMDDNLRIWRSFQLGSMVDLVMLDTRNYDRSITDLGWNDQYIELIRDEASRSLMGSRQENWFYRTLEQSKRRGATWRIVGSQVVFSGAAGPGTDDWGVPISLFLTFFAGFEWRRGMLTAEMYPGVPRQPESDSQAPIRQGYRE
jgi:alkaline phosphatase D